MAEDGATVNVLGIIVVNPALSILGGFYSNEKVLTMRIIILVENCTT